MKKYDRKAKIKESIEQMAEVARFLLEANKHQYIIDELPKEELQHLREVVAELSMNIYEITRTAEEWLRLYQKEQRENNLKAKVAHNGI